MNNRIMAMLFALVAAMFISIVPVKAEAVTPCKNHQLVWQKDATKHRQYCTVCGFEKVAETNHAANLVEIPKNGTHHREVCYTCGYDVTVAHKAFDDNGVCRCSECREIVDHAYEQFKGADTHAMICKVCGNTKDQAAHTWTATDNGNGKHTKTCSGCEKTVSEEHKDSLDDKDCVCDDCGAPVDTNHSPVEVAGKAETCTETGISGHLKCQFCGKLFSKSIPGKVLTEADIITEAKGHKAWSTWKTDENGHYHGCQNAGCEEKLEYTEHTMEWEYDGSNKHWAECSVCGYALEGENHTYVYTGKDGDKHDAECAVCGKVVENRDCVDENKDHKCDKCRDYLTHGYNEGYMGEVVYKKVTCTEDGIKTHKTCTVCGLILRPDGTVVTEADLVNKAIGHKMNEAWEWKQNADGTAHFKYCANEGCDAHIYGTAEAVVEGEQAHAHGSWNTSDTAHEEICSVCGLKYGYETHDFKTVEKGSVSSTGVQRHKLVCECGESKLKGCSFNEQCVCKVCGDGKIHEWGPLKTLSAVDPTCVTTGKIEAGQCPTCKGIFKQENGKVVATTEADRVIPALGHNWEASKTLDDADGKHVMLCTNVVNGKKCSKATLMDHYTEDEDCICDVPGCKVIAHSHKFVQVVGKAATCTEDGYEAYNKYEGCGRMFDLNQNEITKPVVIPAAGHDFGDEWIPCEGGIHAKFCANCDEFISEEHSFQNGNVQCSVCGGEEELTHVAAKAATCTENGNVEYWTSLITGKKYADAAGKTLIKDAAVKATGHNMSGWEDLANGVGHKKVCMNAGCTHTENGAHDNVNSCFCTECGGFKTGHAMEMVNAVPATCAKAGTQAYFKCSCGKLYDLGYNPIEAPKTIAKLDHDYKDVKVLKDAKEGKHYVACNDCGNKVYENHTMVVNDPLKGNYHQYLCACGELEIETHYDKNGDKWCDVCGHGMGKTSVTVEQHNNQTVITGQSDKVNTNKNWWWNWQEVFTPSNSGGSAATGNTEQNTTSSNGMPENNTADNGTVDNGNTNSGSNGNGGSNDTVVTPPAANEGAAAAPTVSQTNVLVQFINWFLGLFGF